MGIGDIIETIFGDVHILFLPDFCYVGIIAYSNHIGIGFMYPYVDNENYMPINFKGW